MFDNRKVTEVSYHCYVYFEKISFIIYLASGNRVVKVVTEMSSSSLTSAMSPFGQHAASTIRDAREREKKEMSDLNDRLADYIEKVCTRYINLERNLSKSTKFSDFEKYFIPREL